MKAKYDCTHLIGCGTYGKVPVTCPVCGKGQLTGVKSGPQPVSESVWTDRLKKTLSDAGMANPSEWAAQAAEQIRKDRKQYLVETKAEAKSVLGALGGSMTTSVILDRLYDAGMLVRKEN